MTTIDAAAAWRVHKTVTLAVFAAFMGLGLGGCETGRKSLREFGRFRSTHHRRKSDGADACDADAKIAIAPVIGAPDAVAKQLQTQLATVIEGTADHASPRRRARRPSTRCAATSSPRAKRARTKVSYIWDVTDPTGKRVNRITGEEVLTGRAEQGSVGGGDAAGGRHDRQQDRRLAGDVAADAEPGRHCRGHADTRAPIRPRRPVQRHRRRQPRAAYRRDCRRSRSLGCAAARTTGSIARDGAVNAMVPTVTGAPGDGSVALTGAIQRELTTQRHRPHRDGRRRRPTASKARSWWAQGENGKQPIQIDWSVTDPQGKKLGTVSQKNEIPQGSLDGAWGKTADAAAAAAAQGIVKLLPPSPRPTDAARPSGHT